MKDAIPYLFGAVREDVLLIEHQIKELRKEQRKLNTIKNEQDEMLSERNSLAESLVEEARSVGLIQLNYDNSTSNILDILQEVVK